MVVKIFLALICALPFLGLVMATVSIIPNISLETIFNIGAIAYVILSIVFYTIFSVDSGA